MREIGIIYEPDVEYRFGSSTCYGSTHTIFVHAGKFYLRCDKSTDRKPREVESDCLDEVLAHTELKIQ